jgi:hypothetical protein
MPVEEHRQIVLKATEAGFGIGGERALERRSSAGA